jgi:hypothetical protein
MDEDDDRPSLWERIKCFFGRHRYQPAFHRRTWYAKRKQRYLITEFRLRCKHCDRPTRWWPQRRMAEITKKLNVRW